MIIYISPCTALRPPIQPCARQLQPLTRDWLKPKSLHHTCIHRSCSHGCNHWLRPESLLCNGRFHNPSRGYTFEGYVSGGRPIRGFGIIPQCLTTKCFHSLSPESSRRPDVGARSPTWVGLILTALGPQQCHKGDKLSCAVVFSCSMASLFFSTRVYLQLTFHFARSFLQQWHSHPKASSRS